MEALTCRLLPYAVADGPANMAADEVLLRSAAQGRTSLRFYGWAEVTVSLDFIKSYGDKRTEAIQDLAWALLNSKDFLLTH